MQSISPGFDSLHPSVSAASQAAVIVDAAWSKSISGRLDPVFHARVKQSVEELEGRYGKLIKIARSKPFEEAGNFCIGQGREMLLPAELFRKSLRGAKTGLSAER